MYASRSTRTLLAYVLSVAIFARGQSPIYGQCGGQDWQGATTCAAGSVCTYATQYYSQCLPGTASVTSSTVSRSTSTVSSSTVSVSRSTSASATPTSSTPLPTGSACAIPPASAGSLQYTGVNIAGFDFGCNVDGNCQATSAYPPLTQYYGADGAGQMQHFVNDDGFNTFRLPVGWQFLTGDVQGGVLIEENMVKYDALVDACLDTGAYCIIDVHNYARYNGGIIGQGGPTNAQFAALWESLAARYKDKTKLIFGLMNEPHDVPDIKLWAASCQAAVTAIRNTGATQMILLPGNNYTSASQFISNGSADALKAVTNPDGSVTGLVFDVHKYLDSDNSGTHSECVTNNIAEAWAPLAEWLRCNGRQALNTETGGGNEASCVQYMCEQIAYQAQNSDVILGYVGWAAGNFYLTYVLGEVPTLTGTTWVDTMLVESCMAPNSGSQLGRR